ncbi:two-component system histidine kinase PnpS [Fredinandcohnia quinoae]|uniref:histidine kinase n=1 Tax=Fredinandcohnia quinoae TaxID=2918902 RepID=A0AAW5E7S8_9BACI|nr:HAMP domain-containing sensor histidine kinase [Fredinandcohnia sp. SECRCQ15]MCH1627290.1 ATP-binding protein [Fredinandcohnia sp. SECRCQ15]
MNRFRSRLLFSLITLIIFVFIGLGILLSQLFKGFYDNNVNNIDVLEKINHQIWISLIVCLVLAFIVILFLVIRITTIYTKPIEEATKVANELAKGNYRARTYENSTLGQSINILAANLEKMTKSHGMQHDRLHTLIENMGSGIILIDKKGYINLLNRAFKETFQIENEKYVNQLYYEAFDQNEIVSLVEYIFMTEVNVRRQLRLQLQNELKHFEVYGAPIIGIDDEWKGVVLVFHDISELIKLEQIRRDFVANVSHELKTPITSIKGFSETLLDGAMKDEQTLEYFLSIILKESDRLQILIQDLLDLSKMEQHGFALNIQQIDLQEMLNDIFMMLNSKAEQKDIQLTLNLNDEPGVIEGDFDRLKQVFLNLINNSITYTSTAGKVIVSIKEKNDSVKINIKDTGIGIADDELPRIFERFYRVDKARSRNSGGTGLGLAIVKHIIEAHHGSISVESEVGVGTTFTLFFRKKLETFS